MIPPIRVVICSSFSDAVSSDALASDSSSLSDSLVSSLSQEFGWPVGEYFGLLAVIKRVLFTMFLFQNLCEASRWRRWFRFLDEYELVFLEIFFLM
jgi:hypothetical protein